MGKPHYRAIAVLAAVLLPGCLDHPLKPVAYTKTQVPKIPIEINDNRDVDVLFIIDNSGSMADEQARLARNFPAFAAALADMKADYRIGITTTDVRHPACKTVPTPENGMLVMRDCPSAAAAGAFQANGTDAAYACTDQCKFTEEQLALRPSADGEVHPWLESTLGVTNLPDGVSMADAFACYGPQGINGCGFESPLEAMKLAIEAARAEDGPGFMRDEALLSVVIVTDETDCSPHPDHHDIFTSVETFWNPAPPQVTSGTCWRAGVACTGEGPQFTECHAEDYTADGEPGAARPEDSVLQPIDRYIDFLEGLRGGDASDTGPRTRDVLVSLIAGVPIGYDRGDVEIAYVEAEPGSDQARDFGVAPGCVNTVDGSNSTAVPPVREREVAEAFAPDGARNVYSICQDDYSPALEQIAAQIEQVLRPACAGVCLADTDPETEVLEPDCRITASFADGETGPVAACVVEGGAWATPKGESVCYYMLVDPDGRTDSKLDDMTREPGEDGKPRATCSDDRSNLEFKILRTGPRTPGVSYSADCVAAENTRDCESD